MPRKALVLIFANIFLFVLVDFLFGLFYQTPPVYLNTSNMYSSNYRNYFIQKTDYDGKIFYTPDNSRPINLRYENFPFEKNSLKVFAIGDSFTEGQGTKTSDTWIKQLERIYQDKKVYGINFGSKGANMPHINWNFKKNFVNYQPDLVVYGLVLNDAFYHPKIPFGIDENPAIVGDSKIKYDFINLRTKNFDLNRNSFLQFIYDHSNLGRYAIRTLEILKISRRTLKYYKLLHDPEINGEGLTKTYELIGEMRDLAKAKNSKFVVMIFPIFYHTESDYPFTAAHDTLRTNLEKHNIPVIDLLPKYRGIKDRDLWVHPVDQHPNDYAHKIAATALSEWMKKNL